MARSTKKSFDEQLEQVESQISKLQEKLNNLQQEKDNILSKKKEQEVSQLFQFLQENSISVDEAVAKLKECNDECDNGESNENTYTNESTLQNYTY